MAIPVMKPSCTWFTPNSSAINRTDITIITFADTYTPGTVTDSWDASVAQDGSIMCYVEGTILTIAGNGSGKIMANADSSRMFSYSADNADDLFSALTTINNLSLLDTSNCTTMERLFRSCTKLTSVDISGFNTSKVKSFNMAFAVMDKMTSLSFANLDTSSCEDMAYMLYSCKIPHLDFENWDVSKVKTFDHFLSGSTSVKSFDVSKWDVSSCENFNAAFNDVQVKEYDVSRWNVSNAKVFSQMFEGNSSLVKIVGLESWDTSNGICFEDMFSECSKLKELNLSSFDTRKAHSGTPTSTNGSTSACTKNMLTGMNSLEKITLGKNFTFLGNGTSNEIGSLPTPSSTYITGADGNWYVINGASYAVSEIPDLTAQTYYASINIVNSKKYISYQNLREYHNLMKGSSSSLAVSSVEPTDESVQLWINPSDEVVTYIPEIKDSVINNEDTWSSAKISSAIANSLNAQQVVDIVYPVGSIYMSVSSVNPSTFLTGTTWEVWGAGRVPVCVDTEDTDFASAELTGGSKMHTLTVSEIPSHNHITRLSRNSGSTKPSGSTYRYNYYSSTTNYTSGSYTSTNTGGGNAHNNLQPYITCYMWKRIS